MTLEEVERIAEINGFSLWQERGPHGPWFVQTPHDEDIFFGDDYNSALQCLTAIARLCPKADPLSRKE